MDRRRPENITLPPVRSLFGQAPLPNGHFERANQGRDEWCCAPPKSAPLPPFFRPMNAYPEARKEEHQPEPTTPKEASRPRHVYPSPASDQHSDDVEMGEGTAWWEAAKTPLFKVDEGVSDTSTTAPGSSQEEATPTTKSTLTPSIVHYRPNGIPSVRSRRGSTSDGQKRRGSKSDESKIRMVKWDRVTDKGTAPLNILPSHHVQKSCILCYLVKKKCERTDGVRPNETHPCAACQRHNFVCQFISPAQLREGTTQPPSLESLKLHTEQAQRLRTIELEEKVVKLEYELDMAMMESRVQTGYISNLRVYEGIVNGYILQLKERLETVDPGCRLLEFRVPAMPENSHQSEYTSSDAETSPEASGLISDVVDGMPVVEKMDVDPSN